MKIISVLVDSFDDDCCSKCDFANNEYGWWCTILRKIIKDPYQHRLSDCPIIVPGNRDNAPRDGSIFVACQDNWFMLVRFADDMFIDINSRFHSAEEIIGDFVWLPTIEFLSLLNKKKG